MLRFLRCSDECQIMHRRLGILFLDDLRALRDQTGHRLALLATHDFAELFADSLETLDVNLGLIKMGFERLAEFVA